MPKPQVAPPVYAVFWWLPSADERPMGKPERSEETLTTRTMGLEIFNPFGRDTTQMLHIYADISTGFIGASITDVPVSGERVEERRWEPYMDNKQWGSNRSRVPEENDCNEPDEDEA